jgi:nicotinamidase-related amidase
MLEKLMIKKETAALVIMDYQNDVLAHIPEERRITVLQNAVRILETAREAGLEVIHVANIFRKGYPEINPRNKIWKEVKAKGMYKHGSPGVEIASEVKPVGKEILIIKHRASAFYQTELETILKVKGITLLILIGIATEGCVLSTLRQAADLDYSIAVISDGCADPDQEIHNALINKIFQREAAVITTREFESAVKDA